MKTQIEDMNYLGDFGDGVKNYYDKILKIKK